MFRWITNRFSSTVEVPTPRPPMLIHSTSDSLCFQWISVPEATSYTVRCVLHKPGTSDDVMSDGNPGDVRVLDSTCLLWGLTPRTTYVVYVYAEDENGVKSSWSPHVMFTTAPEPTICPIMTLPEQDRLTLVRTALICCEAVYEDEPALYIQTLNPARVHLIADCVANPSNGYAVFSTSDRKFVYVAFRDVGRNLEEVCAGTQPSEENRGHFDGLSSFLKAVQQPNVTVVFTGHDIGGHRAAQIAITILGLEPERRNNLRCITFGSPCLNAADYPRALSVSECFLNVIHEDDPIPRLPLMENKLRMQLFNVSRQHYRTSSYKKYIFDTWTSNLEKDLVKTSVELDNKLQLLSDRNVKNLYPFGTTCVLGEASRNFAQYGSSLNDVLACMRAGVNGGKWDSHQLIRYAFRLEEDACRETRKFWEWPRSLHPLPSEVDPPTCDFLGNTVQLTVLGFSLINTTQICIADMNGHRVAMTLVSVENHCVTARTSAAQIGALTGDDIDFELTWIGGGWRPAKAVLFNHTAFFVAPPYSSEYESMDVHELLHRGLSRSFICDAVATVVGGSNVRSCASVLPQTQISVAAILLAALERTYTITTLYTNNTWRQVMRFLILPVWANDCPEGSQRSPLLNHFDEYFYGSDHNEAKIVEFSRPILRAVTSLLDETPLMICVDRSDSKKVAIFSAKLAAVAGGIVLVTPLGPAVAIGAACGGAAVSLLGTGAAHAFDLSKTMPYSMQTYSQKLNFLLLCFDESAASRHSLSFREVVIYHAVCRAAPIQRYGAVLSHRSILDLVPDISLFTQVVLENWESFWLSGRQAADTSLVQSLGDADRTLVVCILWAVVLMHELRRSLTNEFSLHIVGTKNVGKSSLIKEVFHIHDIACGTKVSASTLIPVSYPLGAVCPNVSVVDQPGSDDAISMASRITTQNRKTGSHYLLLTDFRTAQNTSFIKVLLALQCSQVKYTIVFTRCDDYIEEYETRAVFDTELQEICRKLNTKLATIRAVTEKIRSKDVEVRVAKQDRIRAETVVLRSHSDEALEKMKQVQLDLYLELDSDLAVEAKGLSDAQISCIHDENWEDWIKVAVAPRKFVLEALERRGKTLDDYGILDARKFRMALQAIMDAYGVTSDLTKL